MVRIGVDIALVVGSMSVYSQEAKGWGQSIQFRQVIGVGPVLQAWVRV